MASGEFINFVRTKLEEDTKQVSSNLLKNIIDVIKEYVATEYDLSEDEKMQIINNMEVGIEEHDSGVLKNGPRFIATSIYSESEGESVPVEIKVEITTEKLGGQSEVKSAEEPSDLTDVDLDSEEE
ncbi:MAG: hypothetical protein ACOC2U_02455 [bacterium]